MGFQRCLPSPSVCESLELTARSRRSSSSTWVLSSRGSVCPFSHPPFRWITLFALYDRCVFSLSPSFSLSSLRPHDRSKEHPSHFSARLLVSRCASRGHWEGHSHPLERPSLFGWPCSWRSPTRYSCCASSRKPAGWEPPVLQLLPPPMVRGCYSLDTAMCCAIRWWRD